MTTTRRVLCVALLLATARPALPALAADGPALLPPAGATNICPDMPLRLTFAQPPALGKGTIRVLDASANNALIETINVAEPTKIKSIGGLPNFNYYPVIITGNTAAIYLSDHVLGYGKKVEVQVDAGAFVDRAGQPLAADLTGWTFTTKAAPPASGAARITVAANGTGDFATIQAAIDFIPAANKTPVTLFIKNGLYNEMIYFTNKNNLTLLGEDRQKTVIAYPDNDRFNPNARPPDSPGVPAGGYRRGMFRAHAVTDLTIANLTLHNTTPQGGSQAEAIILDGTRDAHAILTSVDLDSYQDTLQINGQAYVSNCLIKGDVDFMWGTGPCFFENCHATALRSNAFYTQIRNTAANHGYVYKNCTFDGPAGITGNVLSRIDPGRFPASEVVLLDCTMTSAVGAAAWRFDVTPQGPDVHFWEFNSHTSDGMAVDTSKRFAASRQLALPGDKEAIANYGNPQWVLGGKWSPALSPIITRQPMAVTNGEKSWLSVDAVAVPEATYQWQKNGVAVPGATERILALENGGAGNAGAYTVIITNTAGKVTSAPITVGAGPQGALPGDHTAAALTLAVAPSAAQADHGFPPPAISVPPADTVALQGTTPYLAITATGSGPLTYQWRKGDKPLDGATSPTLRLKKVAPADAGEYSVSVTNAAGTVASKAVKLSVLAPAAKPAPALPDIPDKVFSVIENGAFGDGKTDNTAALQKAIDAAAAAGGGIVEMPPAPAAYLSGPFVLGSKVNLQIDAGATLQPLPYSPAAGAVGGYPLRGAAYPNFITAARNAHDIAITGGGTIDGNGAAWWAAFRANAAMPHRPFLVSLNGASNVLISGVTLRNSPMFHLALSACNNLTVFGVTVRAPATAANSDGIDPSGSHQLIQACDVSVGDDNIAVKPGGTFCSDLTIADCTFGTGHGLSIGGQSNRGLDGMTVRNCTFTGTTSGLRMKADPTQGGIVQNCSFTDLTMTNVAYPIVFYSYYKSIGNPGVTGGNQITPEKANAWNVTPPNPLNTNTLPAWKNITINNLTATGATGYSIIWGLPLEKYFIDTVTLNNVRITGGPGLALYDATNIQVTGNSDIGKVTTCNALAIIRQPQSQTIAPGGTATFIVGVAGTSGIKQTAPTYQWSFNGKPVVDGPGANGAVASGATTETLKLSNVQAIDAAKVTVMVSNTLDSYDVPANRLVANKTAISVTSSPATLTVKAP